MLSNYFGHIPAPVLKAKLPKSARLVYGVINSYVKLGKGPVILKYTEIANRIGLSIRYTRQMVQILESKGYIRTEQKQHGKAYYTDSRPEETIPPKRLRVEETIPPGWRKRSTQGGGTHPPRVEETIHPPFLLSLYRFLKEEKREEEKEELLVSFLQNAKINLLHHFTIRFEMADVQNNFDRIWKINNLKKIMDIGNALKIIEFCPWLTDNLFFDINWFFKNITEIKNFKYVDKKLVKKAVKTLKNRGMKIPKRLEKHEN